jgi:hypothetical protein
MYCLGVVVVCRHVSSTHVFLWGLSWPFINVVCVLLLCGYVIAYSPCYVFLVFGENGCDLIPITVVAHSKT